MLDNPQYSPQEPRLNGKFFREKKILFQVDSKIIYDQQFNQQAKIISSILLVDQKACGKTGESRSHSVRPFDPPEKHDELFLFC